MDRIILERSALLIERADVPRAGSIEAAVMEQRIFSAFLAGLFLGSSSIKR